MKKNNLQVPYKSDVLNSRFQYYHFKIEDKYRSIIENSVHAFFFTTPEGSILEANQAASTIFGYTIEELRTLKKCQIIDKADHKKMMALLQKENHSFALIEATGVKKNGVRFPIEISSSVFTDSDGEARASTMITDISHRKSTEAEIKLTNERYNLVLRATKDLIWDWDLIKDEIYRTGTSLKEVYGHSSNNFIKNVNAWAEYIHPDDKLRIKSLLDNCILSPEENDFNFEYRFRREDGEYVYINDKGYIIRDQNGKAIRMIGAAENITDRKRTAIAIEESEQRYKMFVQQSTEGIWRIELREPIHINTPLEEMIEYCYNNAYVAECNDTFAKLYGFETAENIIGCPLNKLLPIDDSGNMNYFIKFFSNNFLVKEELSFELDKDGNQMIFVNNMVGIVEGDYLKRAWGTQRNITQQKKAEQALAESENQLRAIVQTDPECIKLMNEEGVVLEMNPAGVKMVEADSVNQIIGMKAVDLVLPEYKDAFNELNKSVFQGNSGKLIFELKGRKGKISCLESNCVPLRNGTGEIVAILSVTRDITESKNAEAQLKASEERYRYLFNNNPAVIIIWDIETMQIIEVNETAIELYGYTKEEFLSLSVADLQPDGDRPKLFELIQQNQKKSNTKNQLHTLRHKTKDGKIIMMELAPHTIKYKRKDAMLSLGNNITEKVQLENSLNQEREIRQQQITEAVITGQEKERTELGEELHDNINQILASTKLYIEYILKSEKPRMDLVAESKLLIEKAMFEIRNLSKSLLPPSLGETGLLQALHELFEHINEVNNLYVDIDWNVTDEKKIPSKLKLTLFRIIQEQLNNVIKHANAKEVVISITETDNQIKLGIKDNGIGFNTELKRKGVGLRNICSRAEVNKGIVSINSAPGAGCELVVIFCKDETY